MRDGIFGHDQSALCVCVSDVDECRRPYDDAGSTGRCDVNADCLNTAGSYQCLCRDGYSGDGLTCSRTYVVHDSQMLPPLFTVYGLHVIVI